MIRALVIILGLAAPAVSADVLVPVRTIKVKEIIGPQDISVKNADVAGALSDPSEVVGLEARVSLFAGRPVRASDVGPPALVDRNDLVSLVFHQGGLRIVTEGRSLGRGAAGDTVRVMNSSSHTTVTGRIQADGSIEVQ
ncbi:MAG: flagellar basal body P-ring formation protein FlgA [Planctomycetes bacterium]|nr:flagellar basal body P-ring formation protein FlgA [Planctomycetota bacterium]